MRLRSSAAVLGIILLAGIAAAQTSSGVVTTAEAAPAPAGIPIAGLA
jgi:hypothetical protein